MSRSDAGCDGVRSSLGECAGVAQRREERRWSARERIPIDVVVYRHGVPVGRGTTRDIGLEGMFVRVPRIPLRAGTVLEVEFRVGRASEAAPHRLPALVTRSDPDGASITFLAFSQPAFRRLSRLLYESHADPGAGERQHRAGTETGETG